MKLEDIFNEFIEKCEHFFTNEEIQMIKDAYQFGLTHHEGKLRLDGSEYMTHPLAVAEILLDLNVDALTIVAALLH